MATPLGLPEGFQLDTDTIASSSLPEGFELDSSITEDLSNEQMSPELQAADVAATPTEVNTTPVDTTGASFKDFMTSFKTPIEQPTEQAPSSSQVLHSTLPNDPNKEYGTLLPFAKDKTTGELEWAVPGFVRDTVHGLGDVYNTAEQSAARGDFAAETVTPEGALTMTAGLMGTSGTALGARSAVKSVASKVAEEVPTVTNSVPVLDSQVTQAQALAAKEEIFRGQQEALAQVALGARSPFTTENKVFKDLSVEDTRAKIQDIYATDFERIQAINNDLRVLAKDTATKGNKERITALQNERFLLENPKATGTKTTLSDEQFNTNIQYPVQNALDLGVPVATVEKELRAGLEAANILPEEIASITARAIPEAYRKVPEFADDVAKTTGVAPDVAQGVVNVAVPDDGSILVPLTGSDIKLQGRLRSRVADSTNMISLIGRQYAKKNGIKYGSESLREGDDWTLVRNLSQRGTIWWKSILGNPKGTDKGILVNKEGAELVPDLNIKNFNQSIVEARQAGVTSEEMREVINTYNAYDDYANIDRVVTDANNTIAVLKQGAQTPEVKQQIKAQQKLIKEWQAKESFLTRTEVQANVQKYKGNKAVQDFLANKNEINKYLLSELRRVGRISADEFNRLLEAHPNYAPAWRDVEDMTFAQIEVINSGGSAQPFKYREISNKDVRDPLETTTSNIINTVRKIEQTQYRRGVLDYLLPRLDDDAWATIFREDKASVMKALADIQAGKRQKFAAKDITGTSADKVQKVGNIVFDYDGGQIQLTIKDWQLFQEMSNNRIWNHPNDAVRLMEKMAIFNRNFITLNPEFSLRNFQRETMDSMVGGKTGFFTKLKTPAANVKNLFAKERNPELFAHLTDNIGWGSTRGQGLKGMKEAPEQIVKLAEGEVPSNKAFTFTSFLKDTSSGSQGGSVVQGLENFANRFDMAPRLTVYEWTLKDGLANGLTPNKAHEAAVFAARNLGVNFTQRGTLTAFDNLVRTIPFSRSFINASDRMLMLGRYEPARLSRNIFVGLYLPYKAATVYNSQFKDTDGVPYQDKLDPVQKKDVFPIYGPWSKGVNDYIPLRLGWVYGRALPAMDKSLAYMTQEFGSKIDQGLATDLPEILAKNPETQAIDARDVMAAWSDYLTGVAAPSTMLPPFAKQVGETMANEDSLGRQIVPDYLKDEPASAQYNENTPKMLVDFSYYLSQKGIQVSPMTSQYLLNSIFATVGNYAMQGADLMYSASQGIEKPEVEGKDIPFLGLLSGKTTNVPKEGIEGQFANVGRYLTDIFKQHEAIKRRAETDPTAYNDLQNFEIEHAAELNYYEQYSDLKKGLKPYRDMSKGIITAPKGQLEGYQTPELEFLGDPEKRKGVDRMRKANIEQMRGFLNSIKNDPNAEDIWYERMAKSGGMAVIDGLSKVGGSKKVDKPAEIEYNTPKTYDDSKPNNGFFQNLGRSTGMDLQPIDMAYSNTPAIEREAADLYNEEVPYEPGFFEKFLPNIRKTVVDKYKSKILDRTLNLEGGYVNNPRDNGGATNHGVTLKTLQSVMPGATVEDIKKLTKDEAKRIYSKIYWDDAQVDKIPLQLQDLVFDGNINHGVPGMTKVIQRALNDLGSSLKVDGKMGNKTLNAINSYDTTKVRDAILARRKSLYEGHADADVFLKGWLKRLSVLKDTPADIPEA